MSSIGGRIYDRRKQLDLNQTELAKAIGVNQSSISDMESKGAIPSADTLMALCRALKVTAEYLMLGRPDDSVEESELLAIFRRLDDGQRHAMLSMARGLAQTAPPKPADRDSGGDRPQRKRAA